MSTIFSFNRVLATMAILDMAIFVGWIAREETARYDEAALVKLPIEGHDPRDLLSGHYVQFRLVASREAETLAQSLPAAPDDKDDKDDKVAVCLERGADGLHHATRWRQPGDTCAPFLSGTRKHFLWSRSIDFGVDRFYVDERRANEVLRVERSAESYLVATTDDDGEIHPVDLVVNGVSFGRASTWTRGGLDHR